MISFGIEFHDLGAVAENDLSKNDVLNRHFSSKN